MDVLGCEASCNVVLPESCGCALVVAEEAATVRSRLRHTAVWQLEDFHTHSPIPVVRHSYADEPAGTDDRDQVSLQDSRSSTASCPRTRGFLERPGQNWRVAKPAVWHVVEEATVVAHNSPEDEEESAVFGSAPAQGGSLVVPGLVKCCTALGQGLDRTRHILIPRVVILPRLALALLTVVVP